MITVRFPSGFSIQYNDAKYSFRGATQTSIYESSARKCLFAVVSNDCAIEHRAPCRTYNAAREESDLALKSQVEQLRKEVRSLICAVNKEKK